MLLFSTDYPHWQFDGEDALPEGIPDTMLRKLLIDNAARDLSAFAGGDRFGR